MQNIEFKAELRDVDAARQQCELLGAENAGRLRQTDVYFRLPDGRLKKRTAPGEPIEWIYYHRPNRVTPKMSHYTILTDDQARRRWGIHSLRPWITVVKSRDIWLLEGVRIHLDEVEGLGPFIEFEAIVSERLDVQAAHTVVQELRSLFATLMGEPIAVSYCDLMNQTREIQEA